MKRNPINILNDQISKATELVTLAMKLSITTNRANKLQKIDLRKYRGRPEKKEQIRRMIAISEMKVFALASQGLIVSSQPIQTRIFETGSAIVSEGKEIIISPTKSIKIKSTDLNTGKSSEERINLAIKDGYFESEIKEIEEVKLKLK